MPRSSNSSSHLRAALLLALAAPIAAAQSVGTPTPTPAQVTPAKPAPAQGPSNTGSQPCRQFPESSPEFQIFRLKYVVQQQDANEILTAVRNLADPRIRITMVPAQNALLVEAPTEQLALIGRIINELDRPRQLYRVTFTIVDMDGTRRIGEQRYSMLVFESQRTVMKQGSRVPITVNGTKENPGPQITYVDIGMDFEATVNEQSGRAVLRSRVGQSSTAEERSGLGAQDPVIRQTSVEGISVIASGKTSTLGSLDVPGSTRHLEVQATIEPVTP